MSRAQVDVQRRGRSPVFTNVSPIEAVSPQQVRDALGSSHNTFGDATTSLGIDQKVRDFHKRIKLEEFEVTPLPSGRCLGRVTVGGHHGNDFVGTAEAPDSPHGQIRCAAKATALALERSTINKIALMVLAYIEVEES